MGRRHGGKGTARKPIDEAEYLGSKCPLLMRWTAPAAGIAMCQIAVSIDGPGMSVHGYKRWYPGRARMDRSAPITDLPAESGKPTVRPSA